MLSTTVGTVCQDYLLGCQSDVQQYEGTTRLGQILERAAILAAKATRLGKACIKTNG